MGWRYFISVHDSSAPLASAQERLFSWWSDVGEYLPKITWICCNYVLVLFLDERLIGKLARMEVDSWLVQSRCVTAMIKTILFFTRSCLFSCISAAPQRQNINPSARPKTLNLLAEFSPQNASDKVPVEPRPTSFSWLKMDDWILHLRQTMWAWSPARATIGQMCRKWSNICMSFVLCM